MSFQPPQQPLPDPQAVAQQKDTYAKSLEQQLTQGREQIIRENQQKKKALNDMSEHQKAMYVLQVDQELKKQEALADHEMNKKIHDLTKAAHDQRMILEQQAANLVMEYNTRKAHEQFDQQQQIIAKAHDEAQSKLHAQLNQLGPAAPAAAPAFAVPSHLGAPAAGVQYAHPQAVMMHPQATAMMHPQTTAVMQPQTTMVHPQTTAMTQPQTTMMHPQTTAVMQPQTTMVHPQTTAVMQPQTTAMVRPA